MSVSLKVRYDRMALELGKEILILVRASSFDVTFHSWKFYKALHILLGSVERQEVVGMEKGRTKKIMFKNEGKKMILL